MVGNMFPRKDAIQNRPTLDAKTVFRFGTFRTSLIIKNYRCFGSNDENIDISNFDF
jgi:hypothetical protein